MPLSTDPFSLVERALMHAIVSYPPVSALVRIDNRISFADGEEQPLKENPSSADLPELIIFPSGGSFNAQGSTSSNGIGIIQRYTIACVTDEQRTNAPNSKGINDLKWRVFQACERIQNTNNPGALLNLPFVRIVRLEDFADQLGSDPFPVVAGFPQRIIGGWAFVATLNVNMVIEREAVPT